MNHRCLRQIGVAKGHQTKGKISAGVAVGNRKNIDGIQQIGAGQKTFHTGREGLFEHLIHFRNQMPG